MIQYTSTEADTFPHSLISNNRSPWVRSFDVTDMHPLIICRGPIRMEAMQTFDQLGIEHYGILLSEKDSIVYRNALAPELRKLQNPNRIHRVPDYSGASAAERTERIQQIIRIAKEFGYNSIFAGYGFMAEEEDLAASIENANLMFIGPCSQTIRGAGFKDEAKRTAQKVDVSIVPGIDNLTNRTLLSKYPEPSDLRNLVEAENLKVSTLFDSKDIDLNEAANEILNAGYKKGIDLITEAEIGEQLIQCITELYKKYPEHRIRLKAIGGGGGKGQRILPSPYDFEGTLKDRIAAVAKVAPEKAREVLAEVKATGVGANKNVLIELNIDTTRHQEIQVVGNGDWCITMGGRDCSLQMHEQKLVEISLIKEELEVAAKKAKGAAKTSLRTEIFNLQSMEDEAARFGKAVGLDSVSTFESIVDQDRHFFMEMNTRVQVEHRVTELCYTLRFTNPVDPEDYFDVVSIVELMVLLSRHGKRLPKPSRFLAKPASIEIRLNATNPALQPHAGGSIEYWSAPSKGEIRDDQGISIRNPDNNRFISYNLAGAYDSNIALMLTTGNNRQKVYENIAEILRVSRLSGRDLHTNLEFHYGLIHWFLHNGVYTQATTRFVQPYLAQVGVLKNYCGQVALPIIWKGFKAKTVSGIVDTELQQTVEATLDKKVTLLNRVIAQLLEHPHILSGWLSRFKPCFRMDRGKITWLENPVKVLAETYHFLNMEANSHQAASCCIWEHDLEILNQGLEFYEDLEQNWSIPNWHTIHDMFAENLKPKNFEDKTWAKITGAHFGHQLGLDFLLLLPYIADRANFYQLKARADLSIEIPEKLKDATFQDKMANVLAPPPDSTNDQLVAVSGGTFYSREAPDRPPFVEVGDHFNKGDPIYIVEVMKMFNKVPAPYAGSIEKILADGDGSVIKKGQPLFKVAPDKKLKRQSPDVIANLKEKFAKSFLKRI